MSTFLANNDINTINELVATNKRTAMLSHSSREGSTALASPKMATDSDYIPENSDRSDESMSSDSFAHFATSTNYRLPEHHTAEIQIARDNVDDDRIPIIGPQLSIFLNIALFIGVLDSKLLLVLLAVLISSLSVFRLFGGAHFDFPGFRFVSTPSSAVVCKEKIIYVPVEKEVTHYIVKEKDVTHYIVKEKEITNHIVKDAIVDKGNMPAVTPRALSLEDQARLVQWYIDTTFLGPYDDVQPGDRAMMR
jgi:hypothetical protein